MCRLNRTSIVAMFFVGCLLLSSYVVESLGNQAPLHQRRLQQRSTAIPTTLNITRILPALTTLITPPTPSTPAPARESLPVSPTPTNTSATPAGNTVSQPSANQTTLSPTPAPESTTAPAVPVITTSAPTSTHNASNLEPEASSAGATTAEPASPPAGVEGGVAGSEVGKVPPCPARIADDCCNEEVVASEQCNALGGFLGARYALVQGAPGGKPVWKDRFFGTSCSCP